MLWRIDEGEQVSDEAKHVVVLNVFFEAVSGHEDELEGQLGKLVGPTRRETGCLIYELNRDPERPGRFMFFEKFRDQAALDEHIASPYFQAFVKYRESAKPDPVASVAVHKWRPVG